MDQQHWQRILGTPKISEKSAGKKDWKSLKCQNRKRKRREKKRSLSVPQRNGIRNSHLGEADSARPFFGKKGKRSAAGDLRKPGGTIGGGGTAREKQRLKDGVSLGEMKDGIGEKKGEASELNQESPKKAGWTELVAGPLYK